LNILILNAGRGWGGIESHSVTLASILAERGYKVFVGCAKDGFVSKNAATSGIPVLDIKVVNSGDVIAIWKIIKACKEEEIDVIVANLGKEYLPAAIAGAILGIKAMFIRHQVDAIKPFTSWLVSRYVAKVVAVSSVVYDTGVASGIPASKVEMIHNAVDIERFDPGKMNRESVRKGFGFRDGDIVIGFVGKLNHGKGVFELLRAAGSVRRMNPAVKLLFVGEGPERGRLEDEAAGLLPSGSVVFAGYRQDAERMFAAMDIFVLPSTCREAFGMVLIESMAMAKPVVATMVGGIPEIVEHGVNGLLVPPGDIDALSRAISHYLDNPADARRIAERGRIDSEKRFSHRTAGDRFVQIIQGIL
jgi:glycosyltransferase involved in cell wall biosynthesis